MEGSVILPLYVYPSVGAWSPVYEMASSHPGVQFTAIINPHSGPGKTTLPEENYLQAIETLNSFDNVRTIGYVATTWFTKSLSSVLDEIDSYSNWAEHESSLAMSGIFLDEIPTQYTLEHVSYLQAITQAIYDSSGLRDSYIVHNPGALPEGQYFDDPTFVGSADLTIVFEDTFSNWADRGGDLAEATKSYDRNKLALMLHSMPPLDYRDTWTTLRQLLAVGRSLWLTETKNYTEFDSYLPVFIDALDRLIS